MTIIIQTFYISTGAKNAMHTLRYRRSGGNVNPAFLPDRYIRNLAVDVEEAQRKAQAYFDAWKDRVGESDTFKLQLELDPEYDITLRRGKLSVADTRAIESIEAGLFPFGKHVGKPIADAEASYLLFFADKLTAPDTAERPAFEALCAACLGVALERGYIAARDVARQERAAIDALSNWIGTVGERREFTGVVVSQFFKKYEETNDEGFWINKVRVGNDLICYVGKKLGERDASVTFKATIKKHDEYKGIKTTQVNRPKIIE